VSAAAVRLAKLVLSDAYKACKEAERIVFAAGKAARRKASKSLPRRRNERETKAARQERIAWIRAQVFERAKGRCES
jgi:hypothetical protein